LRSVSSTCTGAPPTSSSGDAAPVSVSGGHRGDIRGEQNERIRPKPRANPVGATYVTTGTGEARIFWMIERIELSSPPGVLMVMSTRLAWDSAARSIPRDHILGHYRLNFAIDAQLNHGSARRRGYGRLRRSFGTTSARSAQENGED
jgi:hypothetical protein